MTKTYYVGGANWVAEVELNEDLSYLNDNDLRVEIATRGVEGFLGRRKDIPIQLFNRIVEEESDGSLQSVLSNMVSNEIVPGCGIGILLFILEQPIDGEEYSDKNETFVNSKLILSNVGVPGLVDQFDKKYPNFKTT